MDPDATWDELVERLNQNSALSHDAAWIILELSEALRDWITRDGLLPKALADSGINRRGAMRLLDGLNDLMAAY